MTHLALPAALPAWLTSRRARAGLLVAVTLVAAALLSWRLWHTPISLPLDTPMPTNPAIEAQWGIRVTQVALTADGGLVDFRFIVIDPDKAQALVSDNALLPVLEVKGTQTVVSTPALLHRHNLEAGRIYVILYRNTGNAVHTGSALSVKFGDLTLDPVVVQ